MTDNEQKEVFSKNLRRLIIESGKSQKEIAQELGFKSTTFNTWCMGKILPSMGKLQRIADYFDVGKTFLLEEHSYEEYYTDSTTAEIAQEMFENKELKALFDVQRDMTPEDLKAMYGIALALKRKERGTD